jgi:hypothetical protein
VDKQVRSKPKVPTQAVCAEHLELRKEVITLIQLQKQVQAKEAEVAALRENPFADVPATPSTPKRPYRGVDNERVATRATAVGTDFDSFLGGSGIITFFLFCCSCGIISCFCMWILALTVL